MVASVPELVMRTNDMLGTSWLMVSASSISISVGQPKLSPLWAASTTASRTRGWLWPIIIGPQEST